ncbi:hypothetical protein PVAP13_6NG107703 [Panicum virgatum]|uniref:Uncharacterized protein n=1 Tax=Panicum virgatum TaxID=38727 RepID=A0A8T0QVS6_PANVG|nr:hypothetical protein PVAP13_6NG107703 [Panicum virgatum]
MWRIGKTAPATRAGSHREVEKIQNEKFHLWFRGHIERADGIHSLKDGIRWLAHGPVEAAKRYRAFNSRGFRFRPKQLDGGDSK